jgi:pimeloyl-ACP methyl ester carboxylesterase
MNERAVTFGSRGALVGILGEPDGEAKPGTPAVLLFNVGLNHRVGPGRLNVEVARSLASAGYTSLRFDVSGLGDSQPRSDQQGDAGMVPLELGEAMDLVRRRTGINGFVVVGLCSGVDGTHAATLSDPRIKGAVFIDGYAYPTPRYHLVRTVRKARAYFAPSFWRRWIWWKARRIQGRSANVDAETGVPEPIFDRTYPPRQAFRADLLALVKRRVKMLFLFTVDAWFFNHGSQFARMIGERTLPDGVEVEYWTDADHVFRSVAVRRRVVQRLTAWIEAAFPAARAREARTSIS